MINDLESRATDIDRVVISSELGGLQTKCCKGSRKISICTVHPLHCQTIQNGHGDGRTGAK